MTKDKFSKEPSRQKPQKIRHKIKVHAKNVISYSAQIGLVLIGLLVLGFSVWWIYFVLNEPKMLANYVPDNASAFIELNLNKLNLADQDSLDKFLQQKGLKYDNLNIFINNFFSSPKDFDANSFLGDIYGVAFLGNFNQFTDKSIIYAEIKNKNKFNEFLAALLKINNQKNLDSVVLNGKTFYVYPGAQSLYFYLFDHYILLSHDANDLQNTLLSIEAGDVLRNTSNFNLALHNLPQFKAIFAFINSQDFLNLSDLNSNPKSVFIRNIFDMADFLSFTGYLDQNNLIVDSYLGFSQPFKDAFQNLSVRSQYKGNLSAIVDNSFDFVLAGENMQMDYEVMKGAFDKIHPSMGLLMDGVLNAQLEKLFGPGFDTKEVLNLLSSEYQLAYKYNGQSLDYVAAIDISGILAASDLVDKLLTAFVTQNPFAVPRLEQITLPDGTPSSKLVTDLENVEESPAMNYKNFILKVLHFSQSTKNCVIAVNNRTVIISSNVDLVEKSIDNLGTLQNNVVPEDLKSYSDQVMYLSKEFLVKNVNNDFIKNYLGNIWSGEKVSSEGIYVRMKQEIKEEEE